MQTADVPELIIIRKTCVLWCQTCIWGEFQSRYQYTHKCIKSQYLANYMYKKTHTTSFTLTNVNSPVHFNKYMMKKNWVVVLKCVNNFSFILKILFTFGFVVWWVVDNSSTTTFYQWCQKNDFVRLEMEKN